MALADHEPSKLPPGRPCSIGRLIEDLDDTDRAELARWFEQYSESEIYRSLTKAGHVVGHQSIGRHRRGSCSCH